jgi:hypothetical protein
MPQLPVRSSGYENFLSFRRSATNHAVTALAVGATLVVLVPLIAILGYLLYKGFSSLNLAFFTHVPAPVGEPGGGMANAIVGSGVILALASAMGIPFGIGAGVYLAEYGAGSKFAGAVRFTADVLNGVPSIVMGIAGYSLIVAHQHHFSGFAGSVALATTPQGVATDAAEAVDAYLDCHVFLNLLNPYEATKARHRGQPTVASKVHRFCCTGRLCGTNHSYARLVARDTHEKTFQAWTE